MIVGVETKGIGGDSRRSHPPDPSTPLPAGFQWTGGAQKGDKPWMGRSGTAKVSASRSAALMGTSFRPLAKGLADTETASGEVKEAMIILKGYGNLPGTD